MRTVNIHEAKTHLSRLIEQAVEGKPFIIAKAGKPLVRVTSLESSIPAKKRRIGFMAGQIKVPKDFDTYGEKEIETLLEAVA